MSSSSNTYINPFEVLLNKEEVNINEKSDYILALIEILINRELTATEFSLVYGSMQILYENFYQNPSEENMPTFTDFYNILEEKEINNNNQTAKELKEALEVFVKGSLGLFNNKTNVDIKNKFIVFDIKELSGVLSNAGMFVINEFIKTQTYKNHNKELWTRTYIDEVHRILRREKSAIYLLDMYKTFRKRAGILTGVTQNVTDFLGNDVCRAILQNSNFIIMLEQSHYDSEILSKMLQITSEKLNYITSSKSGVGLIKYQDQLIAFENLIPKDTKVYSLINTDQRVKRL